MDVLIKAIAIATALASVILGFLLWPGEVDKFAACRHLSGATTGWLACLNAAERGGEVARQSAILLSLGVGVGGMIQAVLIYGLGHLVARVDDLAAHLVPRNGGDTPLPRAHVDDAALPPRADPFAFSGRA